MKKLSRGISIFLALALVMTLIPVVAMASGEQTIYFRNTAQWSKVMIYYWADSQEFVTWPGVEMEQVEGTKYSASIPAEATYVIFTDGTNQTADLTIPSDYNMYIYGTGWVDSTTEIVATRTIFFDNTSNWSTVSIYYWADGVSMTTWPGATMTLVDGTIYSFALPESATYVIFSEGGNNQTADLTLEDGKNLYVYDTGWSTYDSCEHSWDEGIVTPATCTKDGQTLYTCVSCGETKTETIAATGHSYVDGVCSGCGVKEPCTSHSWDEGTTTPATCTTDGQTLYTCVSCGETKTETIAATGHSYVDGVCSSCGLVESCTEHSWDEGTVTKEPTCWLSGEKTVTCTRCGATDTVTIPGGHNLYVSDVLEPTCTSTGKEYIKCTGCLYSADRTLPKIDHSYTPGQQIAPTCTEDGYTVMTCTCGAETKGDIVYHTGHSWDGQTCTTCGETCAHSYVDGICVNCSDGGPEYVEGWYEIANAAQLRWFAAQVNSGNNAINGKLIADIDLNGSTWTSIGYYCSDTLDPNTLPYTGTFDGQGHTVSNFTTAGTDNEGLFGYCSSATIMNLGIINAKVTGWRAGAVAGYALTSNIIACYAIDCTITGKTSNSVALNSGTVYIAPVAGPQGGIVKNCYALNCQLIGDTTLSVYATPVGGTDTQNGYYCGITYASDFSSVRNSTEVTADQLASGEVTYKLNQGVTDGTQSWYQTCGTGLPAHQGATVYQLKNGTYANELTSCDHNYTASVTAPTCTADGKTVYTCTDCGDSYEEVIPATGHSYVGGTCQSCGEAEPSTVVKPTMTVTGTSLSFEDEIFYNIYYTVDDASSVVEMGLVTFAEKLADGTHANAVDIIPGYVSGGGEYMVHTNGIPAKNMGDAVYFRIYAKLTDGSYVYGDVAGYHAVAYAKSILAKSTNANMKALVVAMVNYGAEAQLYFGYNTDSLMNSFLTAEQQALVAAYDESMIASVVSADSSKTAAFPKTTGAFKVSTSVSFDGAFSVNYYFTPGFAIDGDMTLYYWDAATYASADALTKDNATSVMTMTLAGSEYWGVVAGIAAKEIDQTIYVAAVYESNGVEYTSGVTAYSLGHYCKTQAAKETSAMKDFAAATGVYGYYAKQYFASIA